MPAWIRRSTPAWTMSSETSIESHAGVRLKSDTTGDLQPWQFFTLAGLIGATIVVFVSRGQTPSGIILLSLIIFTAAIVGIAAWRTLAPLTSKDDPAGPQILGGRTRAALEREKALVLRTIKELEFDRAMGKVSDKDFVEMSTRLRVRAAGLIRQLDAGTGYREKIEQEVRRRVGSAGSAEDGTRRNPAYANADAVSAPTAGRVPRSATDIVSEAGQVLRSATDIFSEVGRVPRSGPAVCGSCGTANDEDAKFCKHCGARVSAA
jgi:hypothetical protein